MSKNHYQMEIRLVVMLAAKQNAHWQHCLCSLSYACLYTWCVWQTNPGVYTNAFVHLLETNSNNNEKNYENFTKPIIYLAIYLFLSVCLPCLILFIIILFVGLLVERCCILPFVFFWFLIWEGEWSAWIWLKRRTLYLFILALSIAVRCLHVQVLYLQRNMSWVYWF